jgi:DNA replication protein DnaC
MDTLKRILAGTIPIPTKTRESSKVVDLPPIDVAGALINAGVPMKYRKARMEDFNPEIDWVQRVGNNKPLDDPGGLFLTGLVGRGKTYLAAAIMASRIPTDAHSVKHQERWSHNDSESILTEYHHWIISALWVSVPDFLLTIRGTFGDGSRSESEESIIEKYCKPTLLVLDDFGAEQSTDWTAPTVYMLISRRINDCKPTIVTSNMPLDMIDKTDSRLASRLGGMAYRRLIGEDRRLK